LAIGTIRPATRTEYNENAKIRIVLEGLRGETGIRELCQYEGFAINPYYMGSHKFLEARQQRLLGDTQHQAIRREVSELRTEVDQSNQLAAHLNLVDVSFGQGGSESTLLVGGAHRRRVSLQASTPRERMFQRLSRQGNFPLYLFCQQ
jgi:transposase